MKKETLKNHIRKLYYARLAISFLFLAVTVLVIITNPFDKRIGTVTPNSLSTISKLYDNRSNYVRLTVDNLMYTGTDYVVNGRTKAYFYYTVEDGKCYYFILSKNIADKSTIEHMTVTARLVQNEILFNSLVNNMSGDIPLSSEILSDISCDVFISQYNFIHSFASFYTIASIAVAVICFIITTIFIIVTINPSLSHPILGLSCYGNRRTLFAIAEVEYDVAAATGRKGLYLTDTFLISISVGNVIIIPLENIVWIYKYNEFNHSKGRTKMTHPLCIVTDMKKLYKIRHISESVSDLISNRLLERYPEIMSGYDKR